MINLIRKLKYLIQGKYIIVNKIKKDKQWFGNSYGGFYLLNNSIKKDSIIYSIGIGEDVSFDLDIIEKYSCKIFAFDPTPKSINGVNNNVSNKNFNFFPIGISDQKGTKLFYLPKESNHVSGSLKKISTVNKSNGGQIKIRYIEKSNKK
jgi:hypothetical protein